MPWRVLLPTQRVRCRLAHVAAPRRLLHISGGGDGPNRRSKEVSWGCPEPPGKEVSATLCHHIRKVASLAAAEVFKGATCLTIRRACRVRSSQPTFVHEPGVSAGCSSMAPRSVSSRGTSTGVSGDQVSALYSLADSGSHVPRQRDFTRPLTHSARPFGHPTTTR